MISTVRADPGAGPGPPELWFRSPRRHLDGWGTAAVIDVPPPWPRHLQVVTAALADLAGPNEVDEAGAGPVAFASLPYDTAAPARFVVPALVVGSTPDGRRWASCDPDRPLPEARIAPGSPRTLTLHAPRSQDDWCEAVRRATARIADGPLVKVVLARELVVGADTAFDPAAIGERLAAAHPQSLRFCVDGFCGASPELLVSRIGDVVRAQPMAGTTPRTGEAATDGQRAAELLASAKNREEHQITIDAVHERLLPWCSYLDAEPTPSVVAAGPVQHLATLVEGRLSHPAPSVLDLVAALHPTPAVGGWPTGLALAAQAELELGERGRYAGPVGWVDAAGNGAWAVGIRGVQVDGATARLHAGVGVVADSEPAAELEETRAKFAATLSAVTRL